MATQTPGPHTLIHPVLASAGYAGGAFGDEYKTSNTDTVTVVSTLVLKANFPDTINVRGVGVLSISAGYMTASNDTNWTSGIDLNLYVHGGHLEDETGTTDASGYFGTIVYHDSLTSEIEISIYAEGAEGSVADTTITVIISALVLEASFPGSLEYQSSGQLQIRGGYAQPGGAVDWCENLNVLLNVGGGTADASSGVTDLSGNFQTTITNTSTTSPMTIVVDLSDADNIHVDTTLYVVIDTATVDTLGTGWGVSCITGYNGSNSSVNAGTTVRVASYPGLVTPDAYCDDYNNIIEQDGPVDFQTSSQSSCADAGSHGSGSGSSNAGYDITHVFDSYGSYRGFTASSSCAANYSWSLDSDDWQHDGDSYGIANSYLKIKVDSGYFQLIVEGTMSATNSDPNYMGSTYLEAPGMFCLVSNDETSITIADTTTLSPGYTYIIKLQASAGGGEWGVHSISSGSESGTAGFDITCDIRRAPME